MSSTHIKALLCVQNYDVLNKIKIHVYNTMHEYNEIDKQEFFHWFKSSLILTCRDDHYTFVSADSHSQTDSQRTCGRE